MLTAAQIRAFKSNLADHIIRTASEQLPLPEGVRLARVDHEKYAKNFTFVLVDAGVTPDAPTNATHEIRIDVTISEDVPGR